MWIATFETRHFSFSGHGKTRADAANVLIQVLDLHGQQHNLGDDWWFACKPDEDFEHTEIHPGDGYRDHNLILCDISKR